MLSRDEIIERINAIEWDERLIISPRFTIDAVIRASSVSASIDIHLGNRFTLTRRRRVTRYDPLSDTRRRRVTRYDPLSEPDGEKGVVDNHFVPFGGAFELHPGQLVLAKSFEWIRLPNDLEVNVIGRSIWGRRGLIVATAIAVHPGSADYITLELANVGGIVVTLRPGSAVGQLFFHKIGEKESQVSKRGYRSKVSCDHHPILGEYVPSKVEKFFIRKMNRL